MSQSTLCFHVVAGNTVVLSVGVFRLNDGAQDEIMRQVAIKVLKCGLSVESQCDFEQEIEILSSFDHPNIVKLLGIFRSEGQYRSQSEKLWGKLFS